MIELSNFSKSYTSKSAPAAADVSLTISDGSITGLLGPNGSGKTTIMKAICGFHFPTSGSITISLPDGNSFTTDENPELCMKYIGYVPEIPLLPKDMRVLDFLRYAADTHGISKEKREEACELVIKECSIEKLLSKKIKTLSKGQQQRVSFAQAIIHNPPNLILDEPVSGLDPAQILQMRDLIKKLSKTKAVLMSTHILQEVRSLCDSLYIMSNGKITASGSEEEITKQAGSKSLEEAFIKLTQGVSE
ncbi:ABC transporter ATP-binding protein [Treponema bryantii]|uniref:ABC transporter ATP-binding protein n=1 Tax=Treponema bryantii TaxID=163 RepID=UPI0003B5D9B8|nr:ABC transporter ATP-binding protein [Treponema bryantii]